MEGYAALSNLVLGVLHTDLCFHCGGALINQQPLLANPYPCARCGMPTPAIPPFDQAEFEFESREAFLFLIEGRPGQPSMYSPEECNRFRFAFCAEAWHAKAAR